MNWFLRLVRFLRQCCLKWKGQLVTDRHRRGHRRFAYIVVTTRSIPERTEELAYLLAALYGANQLRALGRQWLANGAAQPTASSHGDPQV